MESIFNQVLHPALQEMSNRPDIENEHILPDCKQPLRDNYGRMPMSDGWHNTLNQSTQLDWTKRLNEKVYEILF